MCGVLVCGETVRLPSPPCDCECYVLLYINIECLWPTLWPAPCCRFVDLSCFRCFVFICVTLTDPLLPLSEQDCAPDFIHHSPAHDAVSRRGARQYISVLGAPPPAALLGGLSVPSSAVVS